MTSSEEFFDLDWSQSKGYWVKASENLEGGTVVLAEHPIIFGLDENCYHSFCHNCLKKIDQSSIFSCSHYKIPIYCSKNCQTEHWTLHRHKLECKLMNELLGLCALLEKIRSAPVELSRWDMQIIRASLYLHSAIDSPAEETSLHLPSSKSIEDNNFPTFEFLAQLKDQPSKRNHKHSPEDLMRLVNFQLDDEQEEFILKDSERICELMGKYSTDLADYYQNCDLRNEIASLERKFNLNQYAIFDEFKNKKGVGLYPRGALFNHSCKANCEYSFIRGIVFEIKTIQKVSAGDELTVSYLPPNLSFEIRQKELFTKYRFNCSCDLCQEESKK